MNGRLPNIPNYYFYQCIFDEKYWQINAFRIMNSSYVITTNSRLISVPKWLPDYFHYHYLYLQLLPKISLR
jgi:hypothetical protein